MKVKCVNNHGYADIKIGYSYDTLDLDRDLYPYMVRIIDETGEDYVYPHSWFDLPEKKEKYCYEWPRAAITADMAVFWKNHVLMVKRGQNPYKGKMALPGGFVNMDETLEEAAIRELKEETGLEVPSAELICIADAVDRDERGRVITAVYGAIIYDGAMPVVKGGDDAELAEWVDFTRFATIDFAFDHRDNILKAMHWMWGQYGSR